MENYSKRLLIRHEEATQSSGRCRPSLLGQSLLAERKYTYCCLLPTRHPLGTGHTQNTSTGEFWVDRRKMSVAGMWHSPPTLARVWGPGIKAGSAFSLSFLQAWARADPALDSQTSMGLNF